MKVILQIIIYIILIFTILLLLTSNKTIFGFRTFTVLTNSMKPAISAGNLIVIQKNQEYKKGEVITFKKGNIEITHRIVDIKKNSLYQTKGDANMQADDSYVLKNSVLGKVIFVIPFLGSVAQFLKSIPGLFLFILLPGVIFFLLELRAIHQELKIFIFLLICLICILSNLSESVTMSFMNDSAVSTENNFYTKLFTPEESIADHVVISEVQTSGATASQDFIELYNPTSQSINLSGWRIRKKTSAGTISTLVAITSGKSIQSHGFFLWSNSINGYESTIGADISNTNTISDNNSIELLDANATTIDQVGWGTGTNQFFESSIITSNPLALQSIERKARTISTAIDMMAEGMDSSAGNGLDTNNNSFDFIVRLHSEPQSSLSITEPL